MTGRCSRRGRRRHRIGRTRTRDRSLPGSVFSRVLATSLYDDPAAELHEDASARLREHPALLGCSISRRPSPPSSVSGHRGSRCRPRGGHRAYHRERPDFGTLHCGSAADYALQLYHGIPRAVTPISAIPACSPPVGHAKRAPGEVGAALCMPNGPFADGANTHIMRSAARQRSIRNSLRWLVLVAAAGAGAGQGLA